MVLPVFLFVCEWRINKRREAGREHQTLRYMTTILQVGLFLCLVAVEHNNYAGIARHWFRANGLDMSYVPVAICLIYLGASGICFFAWRLRERR